MSEDFCTGRIKQFTPEPLCRCGGMMQPFPFKETVHTTRQAVIQEAIDAINQYDHNDDDDDWQSGRAEAFRVCLEELEKLRAR
jgi:hypothetical protein